jgi:hypothetical protein
MSSKAFRHSRWSTNNLKCTAPYRPCQPLHHASLPTAIPLRHFVGDVHQPLHTAWTTDRGGNEITVELGKWDDYCSNYPPVNLHSVWDDCMIIACVSESSDVDITASVSYCAWRCLKSSRRVVLNASRRSRRPCNLRFVSAFFISTFCSHLFETRNWFRSCIYQSVGADVVLQECLW